MKKTKTKTDAEREALRRQMCDELGADAVKQLWKAYKLTAAAIVRRAQLKAKAELRETQQMKTAQPKPPTTKPRIPKSVSPKRNIKKTEDPDELRLLRQIVEEAKAFRRPDMRERQEHQDGEK
jgi:hypothetical protein